MLRCGKYKYVRRLYEPDQLFDLEADPGETRDLAAAPELAPVLADLRLKMLDWYQATCDVVPFRYDGRMNGEMIWAHLKHRLPPERKAEVMALAARNLPMYRILQWASGESSTL